VSGANPARGEAAVAGYRLRPTFTALVAAETELGPLFALVERAAAGALTLAETAALLWHCVDGEADRAVFSEALAEAGLAAVTPALKVVLGQILHGR
jgi:hypothetical protein